MWPYKIDASLTKSFRPFDDVPPFSAAQDLHPTAPLNGLFLDCGDPRSILFTLFYDDKEGTPHKRIKTD